MRCPHVQVESRDTRACAPALCLYETHFSASGWSLQTRDREPTRSQPALVRSAERRRVPARDQQRPFLELGEVEDVNVSEHNLGVHLSTRTATPELFKRAFESERDNQVIWRPYATVTDYEDRSVSTCLTTEA